MPDKAYPIFIILLFAALLRLFALGAGDVLGDEALYAFRAVGMLDFDEAEFQTTPLEWFDPDIPSWTRLSFHDHPPLVFLIQHVFMRLFGETPFAFRLPSALFGIASVYLIYRIGSALYSRAVGLAAALFFSATANHVFVSRVGLQESSVIFFLLLASLAFLTALRNDRYLFSAGAILGLGILTKYTTGVLGLIFGAYLLFFKREYFKNWKLWAGAALMLITASPVIIYNVKLYQAVGHFDFQLSYILGQHPPVWQVAPGKEEIGPVADRLSGFLPNLFKTQSWLLLVLVAASLAAFTATLARRPRETLRTHAFVIIALLSLSILVLAIGPSVRFLTMMTPFLVLGIAAAAVAFIERRRLRPVFTVVFVCVVIAFETGYAANSVLTAYPYGTAPWTFSSPLRNETYRWGFRELETFLANELKGKMPLLSFTPRYQFLERIQERALERARRKDNVPSATLIVYDGNIFNIPQLWILDRLQIYEGWPAISAETYFSFLRERGPLYFKTAGFTEQFLIIPGEIMPRKKTERLTEFGKQFESALRARGIVPFEIRNQRNETAFFVYRFSE